MSEPSSLEPRMLERRVSNNRADLNNDQQMNYLLAWFNKWSDLEKDDFVPVLGETMSSKHAQLNGLTDSISSLSCDPIEKRRPSLFDCQVSLYRGWVHGWSDDQKNYLILRLREIDSNFGKKYENFLQYGKDSPEKDYFEPGIPPELDLSNSEKNSTAGSLNTSIDEEGHSMKDLSFKVANNIEKIAQVNTSFDLDLERVSRKLEEVQEEEKEGLEEEVQEKEGKDLKDQPSLDISQDSVDDDSLEGSSRDCNEPLATISEETN